MTTKISAIIAQYIKSETRLIIPEVGTLIRRKESGEIVFMEMLKKNDGVLVGLVVNILDVSPSKAGDIVSRYIRTVKSQLATNKKFILDGVGVLLARPDGCVDFSFNPFAQTLPGTEDDEFGYLDEPAIVDEPTKVESVEPEPKPEPKPEPVVVKPQTEDSNVDELEEEEPQPTPQPAPQPKPQPKPAPKPQPKPAPQPHPAPQPQPAPKSVIDAYDDEPQEQEPVRPRATKVQGQKSVGRKKIDPITVVALVAVAMAIAAFVWGLIPSGDRLEVEVEQAVEVIE